MRKLLATSCLAIAATLSLSAADSSGVWTLAGDIAGNAIAATCTLTEAAAALTGTCKSEQGDSKVTGSSDGQKVKFQYDIDVQGMTFTLIYDGTLDAGGKDMKGSVEVPGAATGTFTAKKQ